MRLSTLFSTFETSFKMSIFLRIGGGEENINRTRKAKDRVTVLGREDAGLN